MGIISRFIKDFTAAAFQTERLLTRIDYSRRRDMLMDKALESDTPGVAPHAGGGCETVVSLTTHGRRLHDVAVAVESVMQGSLKPDRIVLWLGEGERKRTLPIALRRQTGRGLEIRYCRDMGPYTKLCPSLEAFPEALVITIDDDAIYGCDLVENLVNGHNEYPHDIIAGRIHRMVMGKGGRPVSYLDWEWEAEIEEGDASPLNFFTGVGGVLYPPGCFRGEALDSREFLALCPSADDIWWNAMALRGSVKVRKGFTHSPCGKDYIVCETLQNDSLESVNARRGACGNDRQLKAVFDRFGLWDRLPRGVRK